MPRKGTTEEAAAKKALKRERDFDLKYGVGRTLQPKYKKCDFCGRAIVVNNYEDGKSRTPRWRKTQLIICPWCNPSTYTGTVTKPILYKTIMSRVLVERLAAMNFCFKEAKFGEQPINCSCLGCAAQKIVAIEERRVEI